MRLRIQKFSKEEIEIMERKEMQDLFKATAAVDTPEGLAAYKAFAAALTTPILQKVERVSIMRQLFAVERLAPGAQAVYPVAKSLATSTVM